MTQVSAKLSNALAGRYRIERRLGEGGMATVYLAEDIKHDRKVAVKVLRPELAAVLGADRFVQEIKTTANLQHPHILPLFDSGEADSFLYYVMPFIDGETLRDKLDRETQLGIDDAVKITTEIADALDYAHRQGVIHRDIKPENILLHDGRPMVADFGIALAVSAAAGGRMTETGLSLGTPHYMSPEQATAEKEITNRSDIYSLGSMLYEMLTGEPPHMGTTAQQIIMKIVTEDAQAVTRLRKSVPIHVADATATSLEKLPADRFESAAKFSEALTNPAFTRPGTRATANTGLVSSAPWNRLSMVLAGSTGVLALALGWVLLRPAPDVAAAVPFRTELSGFSLAADVGSNQRIAISPDGTKIALASVRDGVSSLFVREADRVEFTKIPGTEGGNNQSFSPNGEWLVFETQTGRELKRVELASGLILPVTSGGYAHWGLEDAIVFVSEGDIYQVSPVTGERTLVADLDSASVARPFLLPDGKAVVFQGSGNVDTRTLMVVEIGSGVVTDLRIPGNNPRYVRTGHLVYGHGSQAIMAVPFDLARRRVTGPPRLVASDVVVFNGGATQFDVSQTGTAIFGMAGLGAQDRDLVMVDQDGSETSLPLEGGFNHPRFSPNGQRIAYENGAQIWIYDLVTGANFQLTSENNFHLPWWSADGRFVYYGGWAAATDTWDGFRRVADASRVQESLYHLDPRNDPVAITVDGTQLLVEVRTTERGRDMMLVTRDDDGTTSFSDYLRGNWNETNGAVSPDGQWLAYVSDESGVSEVYTRSFPTAQAQRMVSSGGGTQPVWDPDGSAIYYRNGAQVIRASIRNQGGPSAIFRETLFETRWLPTGIGRHDWDIHPDGRSFVAVRAGNLATEIDGVPIIPVQVVVNWFEELKAKVRN